MKNSPPLPRILEIIVSLLLAGIAILSTTSLLAAPTIPITLPDKGCPMAHCDLQMSDQVHVSVPGLTVTPTIVYTDSLDFGSLNGLGCTSNGTDTAACSFGVKAEENCSSITNTLAIYRINSSGTITIWRSDDLLSCRAYASAPLIAKDGTVIATDERQVVRISPANSLEWTTTVVTEAIPISPVLVELGETTPITQVIVIATSSFPTKTDAPVSAYDIISGSLIADLNLEVEGDRFHTKNTLGGAGNRVYLLANLITNTAAITIEGRLFAIDVLTDALEVVWGNEPYGQSETSFIAPVVTATTVFSGPSGASPLIVPLVFPYTGTLILFDGSLSINGETKPHIIVVRDYNDTPEVVWTKEMTGEMKASFALDLRGVGTGHETMWTFTVKDKASIVYAPHKYLYRFTVRDGVLTETINIDALLDEDQQERGTYVPSSAIAMAGTKSEPVLIVSASKYYIFEPLPDVFIPLPIVTYVIAIDISTSHSPKLLWKVRTPFTAGQFPITLNETNGALLFSTTYKKGIRVIGDE